MGLANTTDAVRGRTLQMRFSGEGSMHRRSRSRMLKGRWMWDCRTQYVYSLFVQWLEQQIGQQCRGIKELGIFGHREQGYRRKEGDLVFRGGFFCAPPR